MDVKNINLFIRKTGKEKTIKMTRSYCFTCSVVCILSILFTVTKEPDVVLLNMMAFFFLLIFGGYSLLSLRLRRIEEIAETKKEML